jgi:hypothetical protein
MATKQYRCIVERLIIRTEPRIGDEYKTGQVIRRHEIITVDETRRVDGDGFAWVQHDRGWSAERPLDGRFVFLTDAVKTKDRIWGINIDPNNPLGNPPADRLLGAGWVRFVFHVDSRRETLEQAFTFYDPIIRAYSRGGTRILLILLQDTYVGNIPWLRGDWLTYARGFGERAGLIARRYRGQVAAYQIWNEQDVSGAPTSIPVTPEDYAVLLLESARAISLNDPAAQVISGGLASDAANAADYMLRVRGALDGVLPVDGIAVHPYGHLPPGDDVAPFEGWGFGSLDTYLQRFVNTFPRLPIWITEIGVARVDVTNQSYWPRIGNYMEKTISFVRDTYAYAVKAVMWFAWSDSMDEAGIVNNNQQPKGAIFSAFFRSLHADYPSAIYPTVSPFDGRVALAHAGENLPDRSLADMAARINTAAPNVGAMLVRSSRGTDWAGGQPGLAITWSGDLSPWALALARYRIQLHAWHEVHGRNPTGEITLIGQITRAPGVASVVLDLNAATLALQTGNDIRNFMLALRQALPAGYPLGLSFDGRPDTFASVNLAEWYPYIDTWHPRIFPETFGGTQSLVIYLSAMFAALRPYRKPIVPLLQASQPDDMRRAVRFATDMHGTPGVTFGMLHRIPDGAFAAIRGIPIPWFSGTIPARNLGTLQVRTTRALNIRATPADSAVVLGQLSPGDRITVLERRLITPWEWVRHRLGWSAARNTATGELFLG